MNTNMTAQKSVAIALGVLAAVATVGALATTTSPSSVLYVAPQLTRTQSAVHAVAGPAARSSYLRTQAAVANPVEQEGIIYRPVEQAIAKEAFSFNFVMGSVASIAGIIGAVLASRSLPRKQAADMQIALLAASGSKVSNQGSKEYLNNMPGILAPTGFFDPAGIAGADTNRTATIAQLKYWREAELKHGRVAMLAAIGFPFAEEFHPIFPGDSAISDFSFQLSPLQDRWPLVLLAVALFELPAINTFKNLENGTWELKADHESGNLGFDPLGLKPTDPAELLERQNREISNGRLAMIAIAGMVAQELVNRTDVLDADLQALGGIAMFAASGSKDYLSGMPGILAPTGLFDPIGLSGDKTVDDLKYWREAELKHGRVSMLAALGFPFAEEFHPIFPADSAISDYSFQLSPLQDQWPLVLLAVAALELPSIKTFKNLDNGTWQLKADHESGDLGFDPLGLKPTDPAELLERQNRELSNGRLAMIAIAGMVAQELVTSTDVLDADLQVLTGIGGF